MPSRRPIRVAAGAFALLAAASLVSRTRATEEGSAVVVYGGSPRLWPPRSRQPRKAPR